MKTAKHADATLERLFNCAHNLRHDGLITEDGLQRMLAAINNERPKIVPQGDVVKFSARVKTKHGINNWDSIPADDRLALPVWILVSWLANPTLEKVGYCLEQLREGMDKVHRGEFDRVVRGLVERPRLGTDWERDYIARYLLLPREDRPGVLADMRSDPKATANLIALADYLQDV